MNPCTDQRWRDFTKVPIREYVAGCHESWWEGFRWGCAAGVFVMGVLAGFLAWL